MPKIEPVSNNPTRVPARGAPRKQREDAGAKKLPGRRMSRDELSRHEREVRAQRRLLVAMAGVAVLIVAILGFGWWREYIALSSEPVATVGGTPISLDAYARRLDFQRKVAEQQLQTMQSLLQSTSGNDSLASLYRQQIQQYQFTLALLPEQTLDTMVDEQLVRQEAARRGITVSSDEVDQEIKKTFGDQPTPVPTPAPTVGAGTPQPTPGSAPAASPTPAPTADVQANFTSFLTIYGISGSQYRSMIESQLLYQKLQAAMGAEVPTSAEQIHARHILVDTEAKAKEVLEKLKAGASFEDLAKAESTDTQTKDKGGDLGWFPRGVMVPEFDDVAFSLPLNQYSDPVKTTYGYHIIQVLEKDPNRPLEDPILTDRRNAAISDWLDKARTGPDVKLDLTAEKKSWAYKQIKWTPPALQ